MKTIGLLLFILLNLIPIRNLFALSTPVSENISIVDPPPEEKRPGPTLIQRIGRGIILKIQRKFGRTITDKQKTQGRISMILGLISFACMFVPPGIWVALPVAIAALIFGIKSVNGNSNIEGIVGIISSGVVVSIFLIVGIVLLSFATI